MPGRPPRSLVVEPLEGRALPTALALAGPLAEVRPARVRRSAADRPLVVRNVVYTEPGAASPQRLDLHRPAGVAPQDGWPIVLAIHGGGWRKFRKEQYAARVVPALTRSGFAVIAPNYALSAPGRPSWPANFDQLRQAVLWIKRHAAAYDLDPSRIAAMGESAGGHLAALLGTNPTAGRPDPAWINAVISFYGPADLAALAGTSPGGFAAARQMLGTLPALDPARYAAASPTERASTGDAPILQFQGAADRLVPPAQAQGLAAALSAAGVSNRLVLLPGAAHGFGLRVGGRSLMPAIRDFLRDSLHLPSPLGRK